jgi:hypothetical protein
MPKSKPSTSKGKRKDSKVPDEQFLVYSRFGNETSWAAMGDKQLKRLQKTGSDLDDEIVGWLLS